MPMAQIENPFQSVPLTKLHLKIGYNLEEQYKSIAEVHFKLRHCILLQHLNTFQ